MITKMSKYDFILYSASCGDFVDRLRELDLVDVTTSSWEADDAGREKLLQVESYSKALAELEGVVVDAAASSTTSYADGVEAFGAYSKIVSERTESLASIATLEKMIDDVAIWGDFSAGDISRLEAEGIYLKFFIADSATYAANIEQWGESYTIELIAQRDSMNYFVVVLRNSGEDVTLDAQEIKVPAYSSCEAQTQCEQVSDRLQELAEKLEGVARYKDLIKAELCSLKADLDLLKISSTATHAADGSLFVMEAWAEKSTSSAVDALLDEYPDVVYFKSDPTPDDNTPVKLRNNLYNRTFELIGNMYALPKYGTIDFTPFFAPFYMLFFAICLGDAGYGAIILAAGLWMKFKMGRDMEQMAWFSIFCGGAATIFGSLINSLFGAQFLPFTCIDFQNTFMNISLIIGFVQIMLAMVINIVVTTHAFGFKYALGSLGWFLLLISSAISFALTQGGVTGFGFESIPYLVMLAISLILMFFFNSPGKNIFANFGAGLWNTYNNVTGILGDLLSYIRLFAIGLSGGMLALAFNNLAIGVTGFENGIEGSIISIIFKLLAATVIILIGHGINLFMSTISSFVHPMRLTFVEFFKNGGFEAATRKFEPLESSK